MTDETRPLGEGWDLHAHEWIAWSRTGLDSYEKFHRDAFLPLVPRAGQLTVDVGCGEGRVSRDLQALGHRVLAIDLSLVMSRAAAAHPAAPVPAVVADAARLPLATGTADCAVAFMSLHDTDHMPAAVREIARILSVGGRLVMAIVHPINSAGEFTGDRTDMDRPFVIDGSYLQPARYVDTFTRDSMTVTFHGEHRPLQAYTEALADAGFVIERLREPTNPDPAKPWRRVPLFLNILAALERRGALRVRESRHSGTGEAGPVSRADPAARRGRGQAAGQLARDHRVPTLSSG
ncbi:MAG TPA: class I SAM-dependent methyltransferase [Streptosporangiaceae bacterium]|nr:class I SAM-dependent methyltransferase [Streptosporangiaceae bacterium]